VQKRHGLCPVYSRYRPRFLRHRQHDCRKRRYAPSSARMFFTT